MPSNNHVILVQKNDGTFRYLEKKWQKIEKVDRYRIVLFFSNCQLFLQKKLDKRFGCCNLGLRILGGGRAPVRAP